MARSSYHRNLIFLARLYQFFVLCEPFFAYFFWGEVTRCFVNDGTIYYLSPCDERKFWDSFRFLEILYYYTKRIMLSLSNARLLIVGFVKYPGNPAFVLKRFKFREFCNKIRLIVAFLWLCVVVCILFHDIFSSFLEKRHSTW